MTRLAHTRRHRIDSRRSRIEIERAIANAASTAMRDELLIGAQRYNASFAR